MKLDSSFRNRGFGWVIRLALVGLMTVALVACFNENDEGRQGATEESATQGPPLHPSYGRETAPDLKVAFLGDHDGFS